MKEVSIYQQSAANDGLPPVAGLAHFEPPPGAHLVASAGQLRQEKQVRYGFRIGTLGLLINPDTGSEVMEMPPVTAMPSAPPGFLGLFNLRGNLVPLYELRGLFGLGARRAGISTMVLVFDQGEQAVGVVIEDYPSALSNLSPQPDLPSLPYALQEHVSAGYVQEEKVWLEFNHGAFFDDACRGIRLMRTGS